MSDLNSVLDLIHRMEEDTSNFTVGWRGEQIISRDEFIDRVFGWYKLAESLSGQQYALYVEDSIEFAAALFGAWHAGKSIWLAADTLTPTITTLKQNVDGFLGEFPLNCAPAKLADKLADSHLSHVCGRETGERALKFPPLDNQFKGLVVYTSGTTGAAQATPKKLSQLATEIVTLEQLFGNKMQNGEIISTVSHQHIYGLLFKVLWPLSIKRPIHARTKLFPEELAQLISTRSCVLISSPAHLKRLPSHLTWLGKNNSLNTVFSSGGVLPYDVVQSTLSLLGQIPIEIFGSSETGGIAWRQRNKETDESWRAMPGVEWRISNEEGLLEIRSAHLFSNEWLQLADCAKAHDNGRFIFKGRRDRIVKIEEKRVSLDLIEQRLASSSLVSEVKLIVFNEESNNQRQYLAAVIVLSEQGKAALNNEGKLALNSQLRNSLVDFVERVALPRRWRYVDQFPTNAQGKTPQTMLHELFVNEKQSLPLSTLLFSDENCAEFELVWPSDLPIFKGHFPNAPVLPGVAQVDWAINIARELFDLSPQFKAMQALKFHHVILPDKSVNLKLNFDQHKRCLTFSYYSLTVQHSSGRILFA